MESDMPKDQDVIDIITALNREMRFNPSFCALLHDLDENEAQRVTRLYLEFLYRILGQHNSVTSGQSNALQRHETQ
jgi:hypothetical protein